MASRIKTIGGMLRRGEITSLELTKKYLEAIKAVEPSVHAYAKVTEDMALNLAMEADEAFKRGDDLGPLAGIPMSLKDNMTVKDVETTCCSKILSGYRPTYNSFVWEKLSKGGAVLLGKANMDDFAMGSTCETSCYGPTYNPYNKNYVSGGSSGGSAASVASNTAVYSIGSDTGGSIRQPAAFCGVVGLKPTYGAVSRYGLLAYASSLDQIGPIASSVEDAAIVFDAIKGHDEKDHTSAKNAPAEPIASSLAAASVKGKRIGIVKSFYEDLNAEIKEAVFKAVKFYESEGAEIVEVDMPLIKYVVPVYYILACAEASSNLGRYDGIRLGYRASRYTDIDDMIVTTRSEGFGKEVQKRILLGTYVLSSGYFDAYYKKAQILRNRIIASFGEIFAKCDAIISPVATRTAFPLDYASDNPIETYLADIFSVPANIAGLPAVSLPCGKDSKGLPIGMQLIGNKFEEGKILGLAHSFEQSGLSGVTPLEMGVRL
ncbi:MAG: Asp-tRNA(Asn)/Glu-tRNA(Gln) amidotransferase subunit GatA [Clostridiales bacterium]|nr:Asp-tRNA(Asn)/Glu-tRNA(Gln) amidotransferase subunit GatA [Clostridiales bacterium]